MNVLDIVTSGEVQSILAAACQRRVNITTSVQYQNRWLSYLGRMFGVSQGRLLIELPPPAEGLDAEKVLIGQECGLNFRLNSYRYFFTGRPDLSPGEKIQEGGAVLSMTMPGKLQRMDRRSSDRVDVPSKEMVRATVWVGEDHRPAWSGSVFNMSHSGFQMRTTQSALNFFELGDRVAVEMSFGPDTRRLTLETHFRYGQKDGNMAMLGLEFLSLNVDADPETRQTFQVILGKIDEFRKAAQGT